MPNNQQLEKNKLNPQNQPLGAMRVITIEIIKY